MDHELLVEQNNAVQVYQMLPAGTTDSMIIEMWLHGRSENTQDAYRRDIKRFFAFVNKTSLAIYRILAIAWKGW
ncbi:MAG: hypothetical protein ACXWOL_14220 [Ktedonobacteraceae bacterium]